MKRRPPTSASPTKRQGSGGTGLADGDKQMRWDRGLAPEATIRMGKAIACQKTGRGALRTPP